MTTHSKKKWLMLTISYVVLLGMFLPWYGWTTQIPAIMEDLELTNTQAGLIASITSIVGGIVLPLGGSLGDRIGLKKVIIAGLVFGILGQALFAFAGSYALIFVARVLAGASVGLLLVGPYAMAANWFERSRQTGLALGITLTTDGTGTLFSLYAFAIVLSAFGWRQGLAISAIALAVILLIVLILLQDPPRDAGTDRERAEAPDNFFKILFSRSVLIAGIFWIGTWGLYSMLSVWMPTIFVEGTGMSPELAGLYTALYPLFGAVAAVAFGLLGDKLKRRRLVIVIAGAGLTLGLFALSFSIQNGNFVLATFLLPLLGLCSYGGAPVLLSITLESVGMKNTGAATGSVMGIAFLVGGFVYPYVLGMVRDIDPDSTAGFYGLAWATLLLCLVAAVFVRDPRVRQKFSPAEQRSSEPVSEPTRGR